MADLPVHHVAVAVDRAGVRRTARVRAAVDEVIVTTFTAGAQNALPLWIFGAIRLGGSYLR
jgi:acetyl-CoA acetyltransferase